MHASGFQRGRGESDKGFDRAPRWWQAAALVFREKCVAKADLGEKQLCPNCAAKFYDLRKRPAVCPKCGTAFDPGDEVVKLKRVKASRTPSYEVEEEEEEVVAKEVDDGDEAEVEETPELDAAEADAVPVVNEDGEEEEGPTSPDALPEGFSEEEADLEEDAAADAPLLDIDDNEEFPDDEIDLEEGGDDEDR
jgi:uncharacterized protein (TIGR02300 family)